MVEILRPVGNMERFSTVRHSLGYYRGVAFTGTYTTNTAPQDLHAAIENALASVILQHPALCVGIINEDKKDPAFVRIKSIDLAKHIEYRRLNVSTAADYEKSLVQILERQHAQLWPELDRRPGWKVILLQSNLATSSTAVNQPQKVDIIFAYHHAPVDGLSGMAFHRTLLAALNNPTPIEKDSQLQNHILHIPSTMNLPPPIEQLVDFRNSWSFFLAQVWKSLRPKWLFPDRYPPWTAELCSAKPMENYTSRLKFITLTPDAVSKILALCRAQGTTITGLLHGLILVTLTARVPSATSFTAVTPFSLRHLTDLSRTHWIGNTLSAMSSTFSQATVSAMRECQTSEQLMGEIWKVAKRFKAEMAGEIARLPNDTILGMLPYVSDFHELFKGRLGGRRSDTYELSNVGNLANEDVKEGGREGGEKFGERGDAKLHGDGVERGKGEWAIEKVAFTQSGMGTGPAFSVNVCSVVGGLFSISVTWLEGEIANDLIESVVGDLEATLKMLGEGKGITLGLESGGDD